MIVNGIKKIVDVKRNIRTFLFIYYFFDVSDLILRLSWRLCMPREDRYISVTPVLTRDKTGVLYSNGYLKFNVAACLKDLDRSQVTDVTIVESGACVVGFLVELRTSKLKEIFFLTTERSEYSKFNFIDNNKTKLVCSMEFDRDILPSFQTVHGNASLIGQEYGPVKVHLDTKFVMRTDTTHIASKGSVVKLSPEDDDLSAELLAYTIRASYDPSSKFDDLFNQIDELIENQPEEPPSPVTEEQSTELISAPSSPEIIEEVITPSEPIKEIVEDTTAPDDTELDEDIATLKALTQELTLEPVKRIITPTTPKYQPQSRIPNYSSIISSPAPCPPSSSIP